MKRNIIAFIAVLPDQFLSDGIGIYSSQKLLQRFIDDHAKESVAKSLEKFLPTIICMPNVGI